MRKYILSAVGLGALIAVVVLWLTDDVQPGLLVYDVNPPLRIASLETTWLYALLMIFSFIPVFALSFDRWVAFYKTWRYLIPAIVIMAIPFIVWDVWFTRMEVWGFNESYFSGFRIASLPVEEWAFFIVVPFCCAFIYQNVRVKAKREWYLHVEPALSYILLVAFLVLGVWSWGMIYSSTTYLLTAAFMAGHIAWGDQGVRARFLLAFMWSLIPFLLIDGALTGLFTEAPIVVYNPEEFIGWRIGTIPVDDAVYGFLLLFGVTSIWERLGRA
ncbi:MAG: lycopene cyclase domain-containing protein [Bacteroidetes bacterium]|nr:lycopene cyclase domain-containing protein [Bacteroidota bacterium]